MGCLSNDLAIQIFVHKDKQDKLYEILNIRDWCFLLFLNVVKGWGHVVLKIKYEVSNIDMEKM